MYLRNLILRRKIKLVQLADIIINDLNIKRNDIVMVHTSLRSINLIDSHPEDLIYLLKMIVGAQGTLLMPTFLENQYQSLNYKLTSNNRSASNRYDLINELFRQMPDTIQSCVPAESFAVWGKMAKEIAEDNYISDTTFDKNEFFYKLFLIKAKIIGLGVSLTDLSFLTHNILDIINYKSQGEISKFFEEGELKTFKKRGIPFFWISAEKLYNKTLALSKNRIPE
jgi:aminoglycoside N3'-acetyltransferase